jgi:hypothetical protein
VSDNVSVNRTNDPHIFGEGREAVIVYTDEGDANAVAHVSVVFDPDAEGAADVALGALAKACLSVLLAVRKVQRGDGD